MTLTLRSASTTSATTKGSALSHSEMDANLMHLSAGWATQVHESTEYVDGDDSPSGSFKIYSQLTTDDANDLVLVVGGAADVHIGRRVGGSGALFIDMDIIVDSFANATRSHGLQIQQADHSPVIEFPISGGIIEVYSPMRGGNGANDDLVFRSAGSAAIFKWVNAANSLNVMSLTDSGILRTTGAVAFCNQVAIPAGGTQDIGVNFSTTAHFGIYFGSGAPSLSAAKGSLYLRSDGTGTGDRAYINTNGTTTWTALTTAA